MARNGMKSQHWKIFAFVLGLLLLTASGPARSVLEEAELEQAFQIGHAIGLRCAVEITKKFGGENSAVCKAGESYKTGLAYFLKTHPNLTEPK